jgi:hypothetical protein
MSKRRNPPKFTPRLFILNDRPDETIVEAIVKHAKVHSNDGKSLFVFTTPHLSLASQHFYPVSAKDAKTAFRIARARHASRFPPSLVWYLRYQYGDGEVNL